jgi:hypothetical protein
VDRYELEATDKSPRIACDFLKGTLSISGASFPENIHSVYNPLLSQLQAYDPKEKVMSWKVEFYLHYFNTGSSKVLFDLLDLLTDWQGAGVDVEVLWKYDQENEMAKEHGEDFVEDFPELKMTLSMMRPKSPW